MLELTPFQRALLRALYYAGNIYSYQRYLLFLIKASMPAAGGDE
jgi:hypothetical protein